VTFSSFSVNPLNLVNSSDILQLNLNMSEKSSIYFEWGFTATALTDVSKFVVSPGRVHQVRKVATGFECLLQSLAFRVT
jgi:hypothetical protein